MVRTKTFLRTRCSSLSGKTVAISGSTGGLGGALCTHLAELGASLILLDRSESRSFAHRDRLLRCFPHLSVICITVDLERIDSVRAACDRLRDLPVDLLIHNAGAYSIPRRRTSCGFDNVFQINFASPYYMIDRLLPQLRQKEGAVVVVGSIAHRYSHADPKDVDFSTRSAASLVYGNAKRYLIYGLSDRLREEGVRFTVAHPGISQTGITAHYPKVIYALIKYPMKVIFMRPKRASLSILWGAFEETTSEEWIGPRWFDVWGLPKKKRLRGCSAGEREEILRLSAQVLSRCKECAE